MRIVIHGHHAEVTDTLKARAEEGARKLADHLQRAVDADICFDEDGVFKTVEIVLHAPRARRLVARGEAKFPEVALNDAIAKLDAQIRRLKAARKKRVHGAELRA